MNELKQHCLRDGPPDLNVSGMPVPAYFPGGELRHLFVHWFHINRCRSDEHTTRLPDATSPTSLAVVASPI